MKTTLGCLVVVAACATDPPPAYRCQYPQASNPLCFEYPDPMTATEQQQASDLCASRRGTWESRACAHTGVFGGCVVTTRYENDPEYRMIAWFSTGPDVKTRDDVMARCGPLGGVYEDP